MSEAPPYAELPYAELGAATNFSFLEGASHPHEMVAAAKALGHVAIGIADRNTLAGMVRAHVAAKEVGLRLIVGCRLAFSDGAELLVFPRDRAAYGRLCRLLSLGKSEIVPQAAAGNVIPFPVARDRSTPLRHPCKSGDPAAFVRQKKLDPRLRGDDGKGAADDHIAKAETRLTFDQAAALGEGLIALAVAPPDLDDAFAARLAAWRRRWPDALHLAAAPLWRGDDKARLARLAGIARAAGAPLVATNAALYHGPERRALQDVLACIRLGTTIDKAGLALEAHAERHLKFPHEMAQLFRGHADALRRTFEIADACRFSLDELAYEYPDEPVPPGWTPFQHLVRLAWDGARRKWPDGMAPHVERTIVKELGLIRKLGYAPYFITVHDIVAWARAQSPPILCQGRGSAANSIVCYCLDITAVDPVQQHVLIERFISAERKEPPDIDVDFEHERREEVMQYIYRRYGRDRAAIVATVIHYRPRSAIRDVGKALGLTEDVTARLADTVWGSWGRGIQGEHVDRTGLDRADPRLAKALELTAELTAHPGFPRHLSQHVGGYVLTKGPLIETVPVGNAAMAERTFIEWDKDDIDALGIMKVDVLALGMLSALQRGLEMLRDHYGENYDLDSVPREVPAVYDMLCRADSLGVFQVESRAQMNMLPRLRPREFYDLVVQVAIVRPGPIQGKMVHPYLANRKRRREEGASFRIDYPKPSPEHGPPDELENILGKTLGVPLFQEQAMRIAMDAAKFSGAEANLLRRAMATFRNVGTIGKLERLMVDRMIDRGYDPVFANNCFEQIKGFGEYGFPESHAVSFGHLVYISSWLKWHAPEVFAAALLNSQPMGFYAPAQIVRDAREHDVEVRHPDVNASDWDCTLEPAGLPHGIAQPCTGEGRSAGGEPSLHRAPAQAGAQSSERSLCSSGLLPSQEHGLVSPGPTQEPLPKKPRHALRLGLRQINGFRENWGLAIMTARAEGPFLSLAGLKRRTGVPAAALDKLAAADALGSLDLDRRQGVWAAEGLPRLPAAPLFEAMGLDESDGAPPAALPPTHAGEEVVSDYQTIRLSLKGHPCAFLRGRLERAGAIPCDRLGDVKDGRRVRVGGVVLVRQQPGSAKGVVFLTIEDETGIANLVLWQKVFAQYRPQAMGARMLLVHGRVQRSDGVTHIVADRLDDWSGALRELSDDMAGETSSRSSGRRHPRDMRVLPASRDFH